MTCFFCVCLQLTVSYRFFICCKLFQSWSHQAFQYWMLYGFCFSTDYLQLYNMLFLSAAHSFLSLFLSAAHSFLSLFYLLLTVSYHFFICCSQFLITFLSAANFFQSWSHQVHTLAWHGPHRHSTGLVGSEPRNPIFLCPPQPHGTRQHPGAQLHTSAFLHQQQLPAAGALHTEQNLHDGGRVGCLEETDCWPGHDAGDQATGLVSSDYNLNPVRFRAPYVSVMARLKASLNIADYRKQIADLVMMGLVSSDSHQKPSEA